MAPYLNDNCVVCVLIYITILNELEDHNSDLWINYLKYLRRIGGFLCSLEAYAMSRYESGIISPLYNKFATDHYWSQWLESLKKYLQSYLNYLSL